MKIYHRHPWDITTTEAIVLQKDLAPLVTVAPLMKTPSTIAGVDMSVRDENVQAAVAVLNLPYLDIVDSAVWRGPVVFPYVPGLLSFREAPAILQALGQLSVWPDVIMADAHGRAHPRRFGLACHLGVLLDMPVIGVAKSRLIGTHRQPGRKKGASVPLMDRDDTIGMVVRTRTDVKPVFVSVGHRLSLDQAVECALSCTTRYRLPEPTRQAHLLSRHETLR